MDRRIGPEEDFPVIIDVFKDGGEADVQHGKIFVSMGIPVNFDFFSLGAKKMNEKSRINYYFVTTCLAVYTWLVK